MANTFKRKLSRNIGTSAATVGSYTVAASTQTTIIGLTCSNSTTTAITVDVALNDGSNDHFMVKTQQCLVVEAWLLLVVIKK